MDKEFELEPSKPIAQNQTKPQISLQQSKKQPAKDLQVNSKDSLNWLIYEHFLRQEFDKCNEIMDKLNSNNSIESEFAVFIKGLIKRYSGELEKSTELLKKSYNYNINDIFLLKEIGKNLLLTGKFKLSIEIYDEAIDAFPEDWECFHYKGIACMNDGLYEMAQACFEKALSINHNEFT